jgi:hypothetical protein
MILYTGDTHSQLLLWASTTPNQTPSEILFITVLLIISFLEIGLFCSEHF